jgi:hypothetical protein
MLKKVVIGILVCIVTITSLFFIGVSWPLDDTEPISTNVPILIKNVSIIDVRSGSVVEGQFVYIDDKEIKYVGTLEGFEYPKSVIEIEGRDRYVIPALWDMHTHIYKITPLLDLPLYIAYGVTNVRDLMSCPRQGDPFASCPEDFRRWNDAAIAGALVGPRIQGISSWQVNGPGIHKRIHGLPQFFGTTTPLEAREFARHYAGKVDALKVYDYVSRESYFALADEAKALGLDLIGHRPYSVSAIEAAYIQKSIEHARFILHESFSGSKELRESVEKGVWKEDRRRIVDEHDPQMAANIFEAMRANGTWYVPTHLTRRQDAFGEDSLILKDPILRYLHPLLKWQWMEDVNKTIDEDPSPEARKAYKDFYLKGLELTGQAHKAGVKVLVGTDYIVAGVTVHDELEQLTVAGLSPLEALQAATTSPAEYFGLQHKYGQVAKGMVADLIILNGNPLNDIRNTKTIESVIFNGNLYDRKALNDIERLVEDRARTWSVTCKILWAFFKNPVGY